MASVTTGTSLGPLDLPAFEHQLSQTNDFAAVTDKINDWQVVFGAGLDKPEGQFLALDRIAELPGDIGWRAGARRISSGSVTHPGTTRCAQRFQVSPTM